MRCWNLAWFKLVGQFQVADVCELVDTSGQFLYDLRREIAQEVVEDFGEEINTGQLFDVSLDKCRIHPLGTGIDFKLFLEIAAVIFEDLV